MHLPEIDKYAHLKSPFHSWDPRVKLVSFSLLIFSIVLNPHFLVASFGLLVAIVMVFVSRIPFAFVFTHLRWVLLFCLFFLIIMPLTIPGDEIISLGFVSISSAGLSCAFLITLRAVSAVLLIFPMIGTMRFDLTIKALQRLKVPNRFIQMIMFTYRYIFVFVEEVRRMFIAANARAFKKGTNMRTLKIMSNLIGMLFVHSFERTENIYNAMVSRGYTGYLKTLNEFRLCGKDFLKALPLVAIVVILTIAGWAL